MNYNVARQQQTLGQFSEEQIREGFAAGHFFQNDLAWTQGMAEWKPLGEVLGLRAAETLPPPPPLPATPSALFSLPPAQQGPRPNKDLGDNMGARLLLPVGRSGWAIAAGYLGLFSMLVVFAPFSIIVSYLAIRDIQKSKKPGNKRKHGMGRAVFGLIMGLLFTIVPLIGFILSQKPPGAE